MSEQESTVTKDAKVKTFKIVGNDISDGYHTFDELYEHRITLYIALCRSLYPKKYVWRSKLHSDGTSFDGWFVLGIGEGKDQITYHLPDSKWPLADFAPERETAPEYDGHTPQDALERIGQLFR